MRRVSLPPQLDGLAWRERELATIVYSLGAATVKDVQAHVSSTITDTTIRSILRRMVDKGIVQRHGDGKGQGQEIVYAPAITDELTRQAALIQIAELYFGGSLSSLASTARAITDQRVRDAGEMLHPCSFKRGTAMAPLSAIRMKGRRAAA